MRTNSEKRDCARFGFELPVIVEECDTGIQSNARMYNYSLHGMYFESDLSLLSGTRVNIWTSNLDKPCQPKITFAEVRWCEEIIGAVVLYNYGVGIRCPQPLTHREFPKHLRVIQGGLKDSASP
jgi:hypothetical protein